MENSVSDVENNIIYKPLKSRFYILFTFSLFNFLCGFLWNGWAPIMISIKQLYKWDLDEINLQANLFAIAFCVFVVPIVYIWNRKGIRVIYFASSSLLVIGTLIRLYPGSISAQSSLLQIGTALTGLGAVMSLIAPPVISMLWFPSGERSRATALPLSLNTLGTAIAPIIASSMVPMIIVNGTNPINDTRPIEAGINKYMFLQCGMAVVVLIMVIAYFPEKPSVLPCKSSDQLLRLDLWSGTKILMKNQQFWLVFITNMIIYGINSAVSAVSITYVLPMGVSQKQAGLIAFMANVLSFISIIFGGWLGDKYSYKKIIIASALPSFVVYFISGLQVIKVIPQSLWLIFTIGFSQGLFTNFGCSASFEMGVETAFPVSEEVSNAVLAFATNFGAVLFLSVCMIPAFGTSWIPFSYAFLSLLLLPLMWFYKDEKNRMNCDAILPDGHIIQVNSDDGIQGLSEKSSLLG